MSTFIKPEKHAEINIILRRGQDYTIPFTFLESTEGPAIDLTDRTFDCITLLDQDDDTPLLTLPVVKVDAVGGALTIRVTRAQTDDDAVMPRDHYWRLWMTDTNGDRRLSIAGIIRMED